QVPCPPLALTADRVVKQRAILVDVTTDNDSSAQVYGQVSRKVRQPEGGNRGLTVGLSTGPAKPVTAGHHSHLPRPADASCQATSRAADPAAEPAGEADGCGHRRLRSHRTAEPGCAAARPRLAPQGAATLRG